MARITYRKTRDGRETITMRADKGEVGWLDRIKPTHSKKAANATPPAFRDALLDLARHSQQRRAA